MRADRLLSLVLLLQCRGRLTAAQLAAQLDVSVRTIYRDVVALGIAGIPVLLSAGARSALQVRDSGCQCERLDVG